MQERTLYLHIGAPKAASTTLQQKLFPSLTGVSFFNKPILNLVDGKHPWDGELARFVLHSPEVWQKYGHAFFDFIVKTAIPNKNVLVSDENMSVNRGISPEHLISHIHALQGIAGPYGFNKLKVLFICRKQDEWLASAYAQTSDRLKGAGQQHFESWLKDIIGDDEDRSLQQSPLDYHAISSGISSLLGPDNFLIVPFELISASPADFVDPVVSFISDEESDLGRNFLAPIGERENVRSANGDEESHSKQWILRPPHKYMFWYKRSIELNATLSGLVKDRYAKENQMLDETTQYDLKSLGYY